MYRLSKSSDSIVQIFTSLCLSQVKEQLPQNLMYIGSNPTSFILQDQLFTFLHNRSLILDESFADQEIDFDFGDRLN